MGGVLVPHLLAQDHRVRVIDTQWFGNHLPTHPSANLIKGDIRDKRNRFHRVDVIIHLANIATIQALI